MGVIDEVDSVEFSSTMKSHPPSQGGLQTMQVSKASKINQSKVQAFLSSQQVNQQQ